MWKHILRGAGVVALAFVLTSAVMFWLPILSRAQVGGSYADRGYWVTDTITPDYIATYTPDYSVRALKKLSPADEQERLGTISAELKTKTNTELYQLSAYPDLCVNSLVDCRGLMSTKVKPFITAILADRQTAETVLSSRTANAIAGGSLFLSFLALIFTGLAYRKSRAASA